MNADTRESDQTEQEDTLLESTVGFVTPYVLFFSDQSSPR